jgi:hypothetical protein
MDLGLLMAQMANSAKRIQCLVEDVPGEQARWKPDRSAWSILEVINHLGDEEQEDFRVRLDTILYHPGQPWPMIDPEGWVTERQYNRREPRASLDRFLRAREESLSWLSALSSPNWETVYEASFGPITAGDMLASWVTHDLLHLRQLAELHWAHAGLLVSRYKVDYAGGA